MAFWDSIAGLWERMPQRLQQAIAIGLSVAIVVTAIMLVWLVWGSGYFHEKLGLPATKADIEQQTETLRENRDSLVSATVEEAITRYDAGLQEYLREKEDDARRTILEPILQGMDALKRNQDALMRSQTTTNQQVQGMPAVFDRKLDRLIEETNRAEERRRERELLEELLRRAKEQEEKDAEQPEPEEPPRTKRKTTIKI